MDPIGLPNLWNGESCKVPVVLRDSGGTALTGVARTSVTVQYARQGDAALQSFSPAADQWAELGLGLYHLTLPNSILNQVGILSYVVDTTATGNQTFCGLTRIEDHTVALSATARQELALEVLQSSVTGYDEPTLANAVYTAFVARHQVFCVPSYNALTQRAVFAVWMHEDGQLVDAPTSCRVIVKKEGTTDAVDIAGTAVNLHDGFFILVEDPFTFDASASYQVWASVTVGDETYESGWTFVSFN